MNRIVCGESGREYVITRRDGWWIVLDRVTRECLSGGFKGPTEAVAEAKRIDRGPK